MVPNASIHPADSKRMVHDKQSIPATHDIRSPCRAMRDRGQLRHGRGRVQLPNETVTVDW